MNIKVKSLSEIDTFNCFKMANVLKITDFPFFMISAEHIIESD